MRKDTFTMNVSDCDMDGHCSHYNCCDCDGNGCGCGGCWSCHACGNCKEGKEKTVNIEGYIGSLGTFHYKEEAERALLDELQNL